MSSFNRSHTFTSVRTTFLLYACSAVFGPQEGKTARDYANQYKHRKLAALLKQVSVRVKLRAVSGLGKPLAKAHTYEPRSDAHTQ